MLQDDYGKKMEGVRDIILKARQEGMSSLILALFATDFLLVPYSGSICISHRSDATQLLFKKVKFYLDSYFSIIAEKNAISLEEVRKQFLKTDTKGFIENAQNNATFYIGTASSKVGGRGNSAKNIHFSECGFFVDTPKVSAKEIVEASTQQVPQGHGKVFIESTGKYTDNYYYDLWQRANETIKGERQSAYIPRFFGANEMYDKKYLKEKRLEFINEAEYLSEYPTKPEDAFISTGTPFFNIDMLLKLEKECMRPPDKTGRFFNDGQLDERPNGSVRVWRDLEQGEQVVVFADPADVNDYCAAAVCSKKYLDYPMVFYEKMDSSQFGYELYYLCKHIFLKTGSWPKLAIERNTGQATIFVLKQLNYSNLFRMVDFASQNSMEKGRIGWTTTGSMSSGELTGSRRKMFDDFALALNQGVIKIYDKETINQLKGFQLDNGKAKSTTKHDDIGVATAGAWQIQMLTPSWDQGDVFKIESRMRNDKEKWRFR